MTRKTANGINERLRLLLTDRPESAVAEALKALRSAADDFERSAAAGVLVDAGVAAGDRAATEKGLAAIRRLVKKNPADGGLRYMLGTAWSAIGHQDKTPRPQWWETTRKCQIDARRELWEAAESTIDGAMRAQAWINLGNNLVECGRWVEGYMAYLDALRVDPGNPVAAGWAAVMLNRRKGAPGGPDWIGRAHYMARMAQSDLKRVAMIAPGAELHFKDLPTDHADEVVVPDDSGLQGYDAFISINRLHLSMSLDASHPDCWDSLGVPRLTEPVTAGANPPPLFAMFNTCKSDYLLARRLAWDAKCADTDDAHHYTDTLDYARYGRKASQTVLAMRSAMDILDRVSVAANQYFGLGLDPKDVYFRSVWREGTKGEPLRQGVESEIAAKNWGMLALVGLSDDFRDDGWLFGRQHLRNIATHRFVVAHEMLTQGWREAQEIEHVSVTALEEATVAALRITRSALMYLSDAVTMRERRRVRKGTIPPLTLPTLGP